MWLLSPSRPLVLGRPSFARTASTSRRQRDNEVDEQGNLTIDNIKLEVVTTQCS
jgi:hypothetical protein